MWRNRRVCYWVDNSYSISISSPFNTNFFEIYRWTWIQVITIQNLTLYFYTKTERKIFENISIVQIRQVIFENICVKKWIMKFWYNWTNCSVNIQILTLIVDWGNFSFFFHIATNIFSFVKIITKLFSIFLHECPMKQYKSNTSGLQ